MDPASVIRMISTVFAVSFLNGCASSDDGALRETLRQDVMRRSGGDIEASEAATSVVLRRPLTADTAVQVALANNRHLRASLEELGISQAGFVLAVTPQNPSLFASLRFPGSGGGNDMEFGLTQELLGILTLPAKKKSAQKQLDQALRRVTREVADLAFETREAFINLQAGQQLLERLKAVGEVQSAAAELAQRLHDAGNISALELREQQTGTLEIEMDLKKAQAQMQSAREKLNRLMGLNGTTAWKAAPQLPQLPPSDPSAKSLESRALTRRLDLAIARGRAEETQLALGLKTKTRLVPGLKVGVDTERDQEGRRVTGPTADIELPLFGRGRAEIAKLAAEKRQADEEVAALENDIRSQVREAHAALAAARSAAAFAQGKLLPNQQEILRETLLHYNAMQKSNFELLAAKERELKAEHAAIESLRDYWLARVALERAVGGRLEGQSTTAKPVHGRN